MQVLGRSAARFQLLQRQLVEMVFKKDYLLGHSGQQLVARRQAEFVRVLTEQLVTEGVKGLDVLGQATQPQLDQPVEHLASSFFGKGDRENLGGRYAALFD